MRRRLRGVAAAGFAAVLAAGVPATVSADQDAVGVAVTVTGSTAAFDFDGGPVQGDYEVECDPSDGGGSVVFTASGGASLEISDLPDGAYTCSFSVDGYSGPDPVTVVVGTVARLIAPAYTLDSDSIAAICRLGGLAVGSCRVVATARQDGSTVEIGSGSTSGGSGATSSVTVDLNAVGRALVAAADGLAVTTTATVRGTSGPVGYTASATTTAYPGNGATVAGYQVTGSVRSTSCLALNAQLMSTITGHLQAGLRNAAGRRVAGLDTDVAAGPRTVAGAYRWCPGDPIGALALSTARYWNWADGSWGTAQMTGGVDVRYATSTAVGAVTTDDDGMTVTGTVRAFGATGWSRATGRMVVLEHRPPGTATPSAVARARTGRDGRVTITVPATAGSWWLSTADSSTTWGSDSRHVIVSRSGKVRVS